MMERDIETSSGHHTDSWTAGQGEETTTRDSGTVNWTLHINILIPPVVYEDEPIIIIGINLINS